nr:immunoglobulin light chain junction region [Macaca mulatta]
CSAWDGSLSTPVF